MFTQKDYKDLYEQQELYKSTEVVDRCYLCNKPAEYILEINNKLFCESCLKDLQKAYLKQIEKALIGNRHLSRE